MNSPRKTNTDTAARQRLCVGCRAIKPRSLLIRLTVDCASGQVFLAGTSLKKVMGRSAYFCALSSCFAEALRSSRLRGALEGRKQKVADKRRKIRWPLEPQLIKEILEQITKTD